MFMLAATTASVVVFKLIGSENFSSAARLKRSEAYQASESGLDAVQAWLTNKAGDVGEVLYQYRYDLATGNEKTTLLPIHLTDPQNNVLGTVGGNKEQKYEVYLTGADLKTNGQKKLEFLSIGKARDGSEVSQKAIFSVDGLYQLTIQVPPPPPPPNTSVCNPEHYAFFGGLEANTQGRFSSGVINGDFNGKGISSNKTLIVTGNMEVQSNGEKNIGCKKNPNDKEGDLYVAGYWKAKGFNVCGNAYIGGLLSGTEKGLEFRKNLYADGGIKYEGFIVHGNVTLGGDLTLENSNPISIKGNFVIEKNKLDDKGTLTENPKSSIPKIRLKNDPKMEIGDSLWSLDKVFEGTASSNGYGNLKYLGGSSKAALLIPPEDIKRCLLIGQTTNLCDNDRTGERYYQTSPSAYFSSKANGTTQPTKDNKPEGANPLPELASQITTNCFKNDKTRYAEKCVPDPLEVPKATKDDWLKRGKRLESLVDSLAKVKKLDVLPDDCIRLVLDKDNCMDKIKGKSGDCNGNSANDKGLHSWWGYRTNSKNFVSSANECYAALNKKPNGDPKKILFPEDSTEQFLVIRVVNPGGYKPDKAFDGNFIFVFEEKLTNETYLPATTSDSKVFIYLKEGATGDMPLNSDCQNIKSPCKRNYFIFSEKDIAGSSGNGTINGAVFLANGAKVTKNLPDAGIEINDALYKSLIQAGALSMPESYKNLLCGTTTPPPLLVQQDDIKDNRYIPVASRLLVKLETKDVSTNSKPTSSDYVKRTVLVMPRLVLLDIDETFSKNYYSYMFMNNGQVNKDQQTTTCTKVGGSSLITSKEEGMYECKSSNNIVSDFYVQVSKGEVQVSILTSKTLIKKGTSDCATVSLSTNKTTEETFDVDVIVESGTGSGWKCDNLDCDGFSKSYPIPLGPSRTFQVCPGSNPENSSIVLSLRGQNISKTNNKVMISFGSGANGKIRRNNNYGTWRDCPSQYMPTGTWVDVACDGKRITSPNNEWECELNSLATWAISNTGEACKIPTGTAGSGGPFTIRESMTSFEASLEWKKYNLTVNGGTVNLTSSMAGQDISCGENCGDTVYHKGNYVVTSTTLKGYCINKTNCTTATADGIVGPGTGESFILNPTANTTIGLVTAPEKSISCALNKTSIKKGQNLSASDFNVTFIGGCSSSNGPLSFRVKGSSSSVPQLDTGKYEIEAMYNGCGTYVTCTNRLTVESNYGCDYQPSFCGGAAISNVLDNTTNTPNVGKCVFISNFTAIQPNLNSTVAINGVENACGGSWNSCPLNSKPLPKDGGYYVYLKTGNINTYNNDGWKDIVSANKNSACAATNTGNCLTHPLTPYGTIPSNPDTTCLKSGNTCYKCKNNHADCNSDWFWGGSFSTAWVGNIVEVITCPASSNYTPTCSVGRTCYVYTCNSSNTSCAADVAPPTASCGNNVSPSGAKFNITSANHADVSQNPLTNWHKTSPTAQSINQGAGKDIYMYEIICNGNTMTLGSANAKNGVLCGTIDVVSGCDAASVSATCNLAKTSVTQGENIGSPTITCNNGTTPSNPVFSSTGSVGLPTNAASNWQNGGNAYYASTQAPGTYTISVSVNCGSTNVNASCGNITVANPTCTSPPGNPSGSGNYTLLSTGSVSVPAPTASCGNASVSGVKFNVTSAGDVGTPNSDLKWNSSSSTSHTFYSEGDGRIVRMYAISCDGNPLTFGTSSDKNGIQCSGSINIKKAAVSTCGANSTFGDNNAPTIGACLNLTNACSSTAWNGSSNSGLPLRIINDVTSGSLQGTINCSDGSSKSISCTSGTSLCESNACPAGTTGAWLSVTNKTGTPKIRSACN